MNEINLQSGYAAVIGDVVGSRAAADRPALQASLALALDETNARLEALQPLQVTIGDEFQGLYAALDRALLATLVVRLRLFDRADVRFGVGWGLLTTFEPATVPLGQDGPAWWAARDAVGRSAEVARGRGAPRGIRTQVAAGSPADDVTVTGLPPPTAISPSAFGFVNAFLACRDELVAAMGDRDARLLLALLAGDGQGEMAAHEHISQAAVSQRLARHGAYAIVHAHRQIEEALG